MSQSFRPGQAVYFHHLHDSRPAKSICGPAEDGEYTFEIEGKARRMLVIALKPRIRVESAIATSKPARSNDCTVYEAKGRWGYVVLSLQSKPPPKPIPSLPYDGLLEWDRTSYIEMRPVSYPAESVDQHTAVTNVEPRALDEIFRQLGMIGLGWDRA